MSYFKKFGGERGGDRGGDRSGGRGGVHRPRFNNSKGGFNKFESRPQTLHKATCAECGKGCEVPFRPNGEKPVFCSNCFKGKSEGFSRSAQPRFEGKRFDSRSVSGGSSRGEDSRISDLQEQMNHVHTKLNRILDMLQTSRDGEKNSAPVQEEGLGEVVQSVIKTKKKRAVSKKKK